MAVIIMIEIFMVLTKAVLKKSFGFPHPNWSLKVQLADQGF